MTQNDEDARRAIKTAYMRTWTKENREARAAYQREYAQNNKERLREHKKKYREANREKLRQANRVYIRDENGELNAKYKAAHQRKVLKAGEDLETMAGRPRPEVCDACGGPPDPKRGLHFDHCHTHGHFRGWLCRSCNLALGNVGDDPARLLKLVAYLKRTMNGTSDQLSLSGV
jgi:hypothetical protein